MTIIFGRSISQVSFRNPAQTDQPAFLILASEALQQLLKDRLMK